MTLILIDLDGTVRKTLSGEVCPISKKDQMLIPEAEQKLKTIKSKKHAIYGISNQGGCEAINKKTGKPYKTVRQTIDEMRYLLKICSSIDRIYFCPNISNEYNDVVLVERPWWLPAWIASRETYSDFGIHPKFVTQHHFRKPSPGMLELGLNHFNNQECTKARKFGVTLEESELTYPEDVLFIGDMKSDRMAAKVFGCQFKWAQDWHKEAL